MWDIIDSARNDTVYIVNCEILSIANREQLNFLNVYHSRCCSKVQYTHIRVHLYWPESDSKGNIVSRWIHRESSFMFTLSSDKEQRISSLLGSLSSQSKWTFNGYLSGLSYLYIRLLNYPEHWMNIVKLDLSFRCSSNNYRQKSIPTCSVFLSSVLTATDRQLIGRLWVRDSNTLRLVFTKCQWLIWSISINVCVISDQLGLQPILEQLTWFIKKSKQFNQNNITGDMTALTLTLNIDGPLPLYLSNTSSWSWISWNIKTFKTIISVVICFSMSPFFSKKISICSPLSFENWCFGCHGQQNRTLMTVS